MCKLDVGVLGLAWCQGSKEDRANFFFNLCKMAPRVSPDGLPTLHPSEYGTSLRKGLDDLSFSSESKIESKPSFSITSALPENPAAAASSIGGFMGGLARRGTLLMDKTTSSII